MVCETIQAQVVAFDEKANKYKHLLLKRNSFVSPYPNLWQVVTGRIELGENAIVAACRELHEETGLVPITMWNVPYIASFFEPKNNQIGFSPVFAFLVDCNQEVKISEEHSEYVWVDFEEIDSYSILPSHNEACRILKKYILDAADKNTFLLGEELWKK